MYGFEQSMADPTLIVYISKGNFILQLEYVDDIPMFSTSGMASETLVTFSKEDFEVGV